MNVVVVMLSSSLDHVIRLSSQGSYKQRDQTGAKYDNCRTVYDDNG